jgi:multidrug resistance efflux pump
MTRARARLAAPLAIVVAGGAFAWISYSRGGSSAISLGTQGWAEVVDHPAAPLYAGRVKKVAVHMGQHVKPGDVIAVMETAELELKANSARLALARAKAELLAEEVVSGAAVARSELLVLRMQATQMRDRVQLAEVEQQRARLEKLAQEKLVQARDVEEQRLKEADLNASLQVLDAAAKSGLAGMGRSMGGKQAAEQLKKRLDPLREETRIREEAVKIAELAITEATVRAHVEGTVSMVLHHEGDVVPAGTELVRISAGRPGRIICWLPERNVQSVETGRDVVIKEGGRFLGASFGGRVAEISPEVEEVPIRARTTPQVPAWGRRVEIEAWPPRPLVLGEAVRVRF